MCISVLIVDDARDDREFLRRALCSQGPDAIDVHEATDRATCLDLLKGGTPVDCVLLDYALPGETGLQVLHEILAFDRHTAVVMITGDGNQDIAVEVMKSGAQDYLAKWEVSRDTLRRAVINAYARAEVSRKLAAQTESLRRFARSVGDDLQEPLAAAQRSVDRLAGDLIDAESGHEQIAAAALGDLYRGLNRLDQLLLSLKVFTGIDKGGLGFVTVALDEVIASARAEMAEDLAAAQVDLAIETALPSLRANPALLARLFEIVLRAALALLPARAARLSVSIRGLAALWQIDVTGEGLDIPVERHQDMFDPLRGAGAMPQDAYGGVGLAVARRIAERHGGRLYCRNEAGAGTAFTLELPRLD